MGIAVDTDTTVNSTIPTRFNFNYPVYLQDNTEYSLNIECDTTEYEIWASRLGETDISSGLVVNHNLGTTPELLIFKNRTSSSTNWFIVNADQSGNWNTSGELNSQSFISFGSSKYASTISVSPPDILASPFFIVIVYVKPS